MEFVFSGSLVEDWEGKHRTCYIWCECLHIYIANATHYVGRLHLTLGSPLVFLHVDRDKLKILHLDFWPHAFQRKLQKSKSFQGCHTVDGRNLHQLICSWSHYDKVLYIQGGAGCLPSTVSKTTTSLAFVTHTSRWPRVARGLTEGHKEQVFGLPLYKRLPISQVL